MVTLLVTNAGHGQLQKQVHVITRIRSDACLRKPGQNSCFSFFWLKWPLQSCSVLFSESSSNFRILVLEFSLPGTIRGVLVFTYCSYAYQFTLHYSLKEPRDVMHGLHTLFGKSERPPGGPKGLKLSCCHESIVYKPIELQNAPRTEFWPSQP